jgi:outer membrane lipoprotein SlyB
MIIVAAGAVTLFCGVGIAVMTGLIPTAHSGGGSTQGTSAPPTPLVAGAAQAMAGGATEPALPQTTEHKSTAAEAPKPVTKPAAKPVEHAQSASTHEPIKTAANTTTATPPTPSYAQSNSVASSNAAAKQEVAAAPAPTCRTCGVVESIAYVKQEGSGSGAGAVLGGVVGGLLGHQVGGGRGKDVATVAGAVGGAVLGNQIEKNSKATQLADIRVRLEDGTTQTVRSQTDQGLRTGDKVRVENGKISRL